MAHFDSPGASDELSVTLQGTIMMPQSGNDREGTVRKNITLRTSSYG
jgi:hypothetical protein